MNTEIATKSKDTDTGVIPREWSVLNVGKIGRVVTGKTPPTNNPEYYGDDYPFVKIPDMTDSVYVNKTNTRISQKGADYLGKAKIPKNSIMVSCIATIGNVGITSEDSFTNQQINSLIPNKDVADFKYLYYFFKLNKELLESLGGGGSVYTNISKSKFESMPVVLPGIREQKNISEILSSLDDKIELNRKINNNLEKIASLLFKQWFIDFDFPNQNGKPYKSSGGKMINSEWGEIPSNWITGRFGDYFDIEYGKSSKDINEGGVYPAYGAGGLLGFSNSFDYKGPQVIIGCRGTCGNISIIFEDSKITHNSLIISNEWEQIFLYLYLKNINIEDVITGSTQPQITIKDLSSLNVLLPSRGVINIFSQIIDPFFLNIKTNLLENIYLNKVRDSLLPRLMNGKIRVKI